MLQHKKRLALLGCGHLGRIIAHAWKDGFLPGYELVGIMGHTPEKAQALADEMGCPVCADLAQLLAARPDYIVEVAGVQAVRETALPILSAGADLILLSIGALAQADFRAQAEQTANANGSHIYLASGAVGGFDALRTIALMAQASGSPLSASMHTHKGPGSLKNTPVYLPELDTDTQERDVFSGSAAQAIALLPTKVNVAVAASLATAGPEATGMRITSVPGFVGDDHRIEASIDGVKAVVDIYSSTSDIAAWSAVTLLRDLASPIRFH